MADLLHASHVTKRFGGLIAVSSVDFTIPEESIVSLIGPNGAGKTTFFNIIAGIYDPTAGEITFAGKRMIARSRRAWLEPVVWVAPAAIVAFLTIILGWETRSTTSVIIGIALTVVALMIAMLTGVSRPPWYQRLLIKLGVFKSARPNEMVVAGLGRTFQNIRLFQNMTALENVLVGRHCRTRTGVLAAVTRMPFFHREEKESEDRARELLDFVNLGRSADLLAKNLPYGDQRRLEIARALATGPKILLLDEPAAGMNPAEKVALMELIRLIRDRFRLGILLIEHDMKLVMSICERITVLDHGETIAVGTPEEVRNNPDVIEAYLGEPVS